jgi:hypothetical protein
MAVGRTAALTTELRLPLAQPTRLMLTCGYHVHQVIFARRIQCIPQRRAFYSISPLRASLTQLSTAPQARGRLSLQLQPPIHSINGPWE